MAKVLLQLNKRTIIGGTGNARANPKYGGSEKSRGVGSDFGRPDNLDGGVVMWGGIICPSGLDSVTDLPKSGRGEACTPLHSSCISLVGQIK